MAAANVVVLAVWNTYDVRIGPVHLIAHGLFKPLLILNGTFLLSILLSKPRRIPSTAFSSVDKWTKIAVMTALLILHFGFSIRINPLYDEWNYRGLSSGFKTAGDLALLFVTPQIGAWYRPLGFISLWIDYRMFHEHVWGYHVQNISVHLANVLLAFLLSRRLGMPVVTAQWAAVLFAVASVAYEPVLWPSARFDLLALMFTLLGLIASIDYFHDNGLRWLWAALACYCLAVLSKESGYAFPVLAAACIPLSAGAIRHTGTRAAQIKRVLLLAAGVISITVSMLVIRLVVLRGVGGYWRPTGAASPHLSFGAATLRSIVTKAMPVSLLNVNLTYPVPAVLLAIICAAAVLLAIGAAAGASTTPRQRMLVCCALAGMLPVATLVGWLDASAQQVRYLYMPALFVMMLVAEAFSNARWPVPLLTAFACLNLFCGAYNIWVYKTTYELADKLADRVVMDYSALNKPTQIGVSKMPTEFNGVLFSRLEVQYRVQQKLPGVTIDFTSVVECGDRLCYMWQPEKRTLTRY